MEDKYSEFMKAVSNSHRRKRAPSFESPSNMTITSGANSTINFPSLEEYWGPTLTATNAEMKENYRILKGPPASTWYYIFSGNSDVTYHHTGKIPNWFHRKMCKLILGIEIYKI